MKKSLMGIALCAVFTICGGCGCAASNTDNISFDTTKIKYYQDNRTGLCFAVTGSVQAGDSDTKSVEMACVPCNEAVLELVGK